MTDDEASNPLRLIGRVTRGFTRIADGGLREFGFAVGQLPVLVSLKKSKALSQAELARIAQVEQPSMAQLLARMERDGLVERVPDPVDKRSRLISLTPLASRRLPKAKTLMDTHAQEALAGFSPEEVEQLTALLVRLNANVERMGGG
ncbi:MULTISPECIES: MarR family transcriptional regulator [unclassified Variovorax]|jgi:DNA-binding MarR family transcriptional regulator|uniref:MarR family winged helix-turn-helix transcriptional regulator n=1 Tax=unclassified Variovorax TaxID=663243 RepID=UPI000F7F744B|nr:MULTISPECIES: MarR family transcriptional regulator [unclassified Variovorax]RSZ36229.1 MarR family transcriptional regulator [Variovorax sp. 553]RSZ36613.1 MarR family transcriptional regulator [Variovorax sp. 679]